MAKKEYIRLRVQELAEKRNLNISQLSRRADLDIPLIRRYWYNEITYVSLPALEAMARVLGVRFTELFDESRSSLPTQP